MKKIIYFAAVAALAVVGCTKSDEGISNLDKQFTITASIGDKHTRTTYTDLTEDPNLGLKVEWEANEKITVIELNDLKQRTAVYEFTSTDGAGDVATFTAPMGFEVNNNSHYVAIYPPVKATGLDGFNDMHYYSGIAANVPTFALYGGAADGLFWMSSKFLAGTNKVYQEGAKDASHLKNYDAMVSAVTFDGNNADINFTKLNAVIKWDLTLPEQAKGKEVYQATLSSSKNVYYDATITFSKIIEGNPYWSTGNRTTDYVISLGNMTGTSRITVPDDGKLSVYMPVYGAKSGYNEDPALRKNVDYTITIHGIEGTYSATAQPSEDMLLEQGKVYVLTATLTEQL